MFRLLGLALAILGAIGGLSQMAAADTVRHDGALFGEVRVVTAGCARADAVALVPDQFDAGAPVRLSAPGWSAEAEAGDVVTVALPAAAGEVEVLAAGTRDGLPHVVIDSLTVEAGCTP